MSDGRNWSSSVRDVVFQLRYQAVVEPDRPPAVLLQICLFEAFLWYRCYNSVYIADVQKGWSDHREKWSKAIAFLSPDIFKNGEFQNFHWKRL